MTKMAKNGLKLIVLFILLLGIATVVNSIAEERIGYVSGLNQSGGGATTQGGKNCPLPDGCPSLPHCCPPP